MAPITNNITTAVVDALTPLLSSDQAVTTSTPSTVTLNVNINTTSIQPTATNSVKDTIFSIVGFLAGLGNIYLGICGGVMFIIWLMRAYRKRGWPKHPLEELVEWARELLSATKRKEELLEGGLMDINHRLFDYGDLHARQMDVLLRHHGVKEKDRPCINPMLRCKCPLSKHALGRCDPLEPGWGPGMEEDQSDGADNGSQEKLLPQPIVLISAGRPVRRRKR